MFEYREQGVQGVTEIRRITSGDFDNATRTLKIEGKDGIGRDVSCSIAVPDIENFLAWIAAVLVQDNNDGKLRSGILATGFGVEISQSLDGTHFVSFRFRSGVGFEAAYSLPIGTGAPERLASIQAHLDQALKEMGNYSPVALQ